MKAPVKDDVPGPDPGDPADRSTFATRPSLLGRLREPGSDSRWEADWEAFHAMYLPLVMGNARRKGLSEADARDVAQEVFRGVWRNLGSFIYDPGRSRFRTWLRGIVECRIVDHWRRGTRHPSAVPDGAEASLVDPAPTPDADLESRQARDMMMQAIHRVKDRRRLQFPTFQLFWHHAVEGHPVEETVAAFREFGVQAPQVHVATSRVKKLVQEEWRALQEASGAPES